MTMIGNADRASFPPALAVPDAESCLVAVTDGPMRFLIHAFQSLRVLTCAIVMSLSAAGSAGAQASDRLAPLPTGGALVDWLRSTLAAGLDGIQSIEPVQRPLTFAVRTSQPGLPLFIVFVGEFAPAVDMPTAVDRFAKDFRAHCGTWKPIAENDQAQLTLAVWGIDCPAMPSGGLYYWLMFFRGADRSRVIAVGSSLPQAPLIRTRFNKVAVGLGLALYPEPRSLAEAMLLQHAYGGETNYYNPADTTQPSSAQVVHRSAGTIQLGGPGQYVVDAPSCSSIVITEFEDGPPRRVLAEDRIDLESLSRLATRDGLHIRLRAGRYGQRITRIIPANPPIVYPLEVQEGEMSPAASEYPIIESLLDVHGRFCSSQPRQ